MEKTVTDSEARRRLGSLLDDAVLRGNTIVVTQRGERVAAIVPMTVFEQWKRQHAESIALLDDPSSGTDMADPPNDEEAMEIANEAVAWARAERKGEQTSQLEAERRCQWSDQ